MRIASPRVIAALTVLAAVGLPAAAEASTVASIKPSLSPNKLGKNTTINFTVTDTNTAGGAPAPSSLAVIHFPKGLKVATKGFPTCSKATLESSSGPAACPAGSKVGVGSSVLQAPLGGNVISENATVTAFVESVSPPMIAFYASGTTPISAQIVLEGTYSASANTLTVPIPPIPTVPGAPNASIQTFTVQTGGTAKVKAKKGKGKKKKATVTHLITAPTKCTTGGLAWSGDFTFTDGETSHATATSPCP